MNKKYKSLKNSSVANNFKKLMKESTKISLSLFVILFIAGTAGGYMLGRNEVKTLQAKIDRAQHLFPIATGELHALSGVVKEVGKDFVRMDISAFADPFGDAPTARTVKVTSDTKIMYVEYKDPQVFQKELEAYQKKVQKQGSSQTLLPQPFTEKTATFSDITSGSMVVVESPGDIRSASEFVAIKITIQSPRVTPVSK